MKTPEQFWGNDKEPTDEEKLAELAAIAKAARVAGVYDPSENDGEKT